MRTFGYTLVLLGLIYALWAVFGYPATFPLADASAPQMAQVYSGSARHALGGIAVMVFGAAILADVAIREIHRLRE